MFTKFQSPIPRPLVLEAALEKMATLQRFHLAEIVRCDLERELNKLIWHSQEDRAERERRRDLVPYDEVLREMGKEIAEREARPPVDKGRLAAQRLASMFEGLGYRPDEGRAT